MERIESSTLAARAPAAARRTRARVPLCRPRLRAIVEEFRVRGVRRLLDDTRGRAFHTTARATGPYRLARRDEPFPERSCRLRTHLELSYGENPHHGRRTTPARALTTFSRASSTPGSRSPSNLSQPLPAASRTESTAGRGDREALTVWLARPTLSRAYALARAPTRCRRTGVVGLPPSPRLVPVSPSSRRGASRPGYEIRARTLAQRETTRVLETTGRASSRPSVTPRVWLDLVQTATRRGSARHDDVVCRRPRRSTWRSLFAWTVSSTRTRTRRLARGGQTIASAGREPFDARSSGAERHAISVIR